MGWQMANVINNDKCKCLNTGQANAKTNYLMNNTVLLSTDREKDVGVIISSDMKHIAAKKGDKEIRYWAWSEGI